MTVLEVPTSTPKGTNEPPGTFEPSSHPVIPSPQHLRAPLESTAHACLLPQSTLLAPVPKPFTRTGDMLIASVAGSVASCLLPLLPQHLTLDDEFSSAQVKLSPHETCFTLSPIFATTVGLSSWDGVTVFVVVSNTPYPACPAIFPPQQRSAPDAITAHMCAEPPAICVAASVSLTTLAGVGMDRGYGTPLVSTPPVPTTPAILLPQHFTVPSTNRTHV